MSLYYDAAKILTSRSSEGSLKSLIYNKTNLKSKPSHLFALISETAKYDTFLSEVITNAGILSLEPKLTPLLTLLLVHDHLFAKGGISAAAAHPLRQSIERHKARLASEFTKARLKRRVATTEALKIKILEEKGITARITPRWVRVNTLKISLEDLIARSLAAYTSVDTIAEIISSAKDTKIFHQDKHIPNLLGFPPDTDLTKHQAYLNGELILQDKASCFPAHLLAGENTTDQTSGDAIDGCAAPGNKTTHLAALVQHSDTQIFACERDSTRSKTLQMMVDKAGAGGLVRVLARQDFLALDSQDNRFSNVTHLLLDPSCSGSGILGREDVPELKLPDDPRKKDDKQQTTNSKKRKRGTGSPTKDSSIGESDKAQEPSTNQSNTDQAATQLRLQKLSTLQSLIVEHAFKFPAATRVTYSTCSIHIEENEAVVARVLASSAGRARGWRVLRREEQVEGMRVWEHRGISGDHRLSDEEREACIRCTPGDGEGTMGFFVCGFVREDGMGENGNERRDGQQSVKDGNVVEEADDWEGFSDS